VSPKGQPELIRFSLTLGTILPPTAKGPFESLVGASLRKAKRIVVFLVGLTLVLVGAALIVLPGPGLLVIAIGIGVLATEFVWATRWLERLRLELGNLTRDDENAGDATDISKSKNRG
jgi:hypothetical protein